MSICTYTVEVMVCTIFDFYHSFKIAATWHILTPISSTCPATRQIASPRTAALICPIGRAGTVSVARAAETVPAQSSQHWLYCRIVLLLGTGTARLYGLHPEANMVTHLGASRYFCMNPTMEFGLPSCGLWESTTEVRPHVNYMTSPADILLMEEILHHQGCIKRGK